MFTLFGCDLCNWVMPLPSDPAPTSSILKISFIAHLTIPQSLHHPNIYCLTWLRVIHTSFRMQRVWQLCVLMCQVIIISLFWSFALCWHSLCVVLGLLMASIEMLLWLFHTNGCRVKWHEGGKGQTIVMDQRSKLVSDGGEAVEGNRDMKIMRTAWGFETICVTVYVFCAHVLFAWTEWFISKHIGSQSHSSFPIKTAWLVSFFIFVF